MIHLKITIPNCQSWAKLIYKVTAMNLFIKKDKSDEALNSDSSLKKTNGTEVLNTY
jgi:hypothetical protein